MTFSDIKKVVLKYILLSMEQKYQ